MVARLKFEEIDEEGTTRSGACGSPVDDAR